MRLPRIKITAHYNALNREVPDGVSISGAIISTDVGRPSAAAVVKWLRSKGAAKERSRIMDLVDRLAVDVPRTFSGPGYFLGCEPKMVRKDKNDRNSEQVQGKDSDGSLKWVALVVTKQRAFDKETVKTLSITLTGPTQPCAHIQPGQSVVIEHLEQGLMVQNGRVTQFWSATALKPVQLAAPAQASPR